MSLKHIEKTFAGEWLWKNIIHSWNGLVEDLASIFDVCLTMLEIELDVVASDVRGHGDDRGAIKLANQMTRGYTVQIGHNDVHQN